MPLNPSVPFVVLDPVHSGDLWDGFTWTLSDVDEDDTEFIGTLTAARFQIQDASGRPVLTLSTEDDSMTINVATAKLWDVTVEERRLTILPGDYVWGFETEDSTRDFAKTRMTGTIIVKPNRVI